MIAPNFEFVTGRNNLYLLPGGKFNLLCSMFTIILGKYKYFKRKVDTENWKNEIILCKPIFGGWYHSSAGMYVQVLNGKL